MEINFYNCKTCGNVIIMISSCDIPTSCCDEKMEKIIPGKSEGAHEKHIPVYEVTEHNVTVSVGSTEHPMTPEHFIEWVCIETDDGVQLKKLKPDTPPRVSFAVNGNKIKAVYAFCNQHGLWRA